MFNQDVEKLALVIPTRGEAATIFFLLGRIRAALDPMGIPYQLIIVDDNSRDGTAELVSALARTDPRIRLLVRTDERGLSGAILHGWQHTDAGILGVIDADLQHPPELLPALLRAILHGRDLAIASRYIKGSLPGCNLVRRLISFAAVCATRPIQRDDLSTRDPLSGFFLVRRCCIDGILFQKSGFKLLLEILVRGRVRSLQEVPFSFGRRQAGQSKAGFKVAFDYAALLARLYRERYNSSRPSPTTAVP
jgi:dolichol-phosphate mannosyltransferase